MRTRIVTAVTALLLSTTPCYAAGPALAAPPISDKNPQDPRAAQAAFDTAHQQLRIGKKKEAADTLDAALMNFPRDAQLRFLRGVLHAEADQHNKAVEVFERLTQDFPELPEPYNNLAVLHSQKGDFEAARRALEDAVRALPNYALAHQNLGDIYLQIALKAYEAARKSSAGAAQSAASGLSAQGLQRRTELLNELLKQLSSAP